MDKRLVPAPVLLGALLVLAVGAVSVVAAQVPQKLGFQGYVVDDNGDPLQGSWTIELRLYDVPVGGTPLYATSEEYLVEDGVFSALLGSSDPLTLPFDQPYWIGVDVDEQGELSPRTELGSSPYSLRSAALADSALTGPMIAPGTLVRSINGVTDDLTLSGSGGISVSTVGNTVFVNGSGGGGGDSDWFVDGTDMYAIPGGAVGVGTTTPTGKLHISDDAFGTILTIEDETSFSSHYSQLTFKHPTGLANIALSSDATESRLTISNSRFPNEDVQISAGRFMTLVSDSLVMRQDGVDRVRVDADGDLGLLDGAGTERIRMRPEGGGRIDLYNPAGQVTIVADGDALSDAGELTVGNELGQPSVLIQARQSTVAGARVTLRNDSNSTTIDLDAEDANGAGTIEVRDGTGQATVRIVGRDANGLGRVVTDVVEILGGSDLSEQFDVAGRDVRPGAVVSIDPSRPGGLAVSRAAYDRKVAGVISGAGGVRPGMLMGQTGSIADGEHPVALTGRVWVRADASFGAITPGDLLTTSATAGHAMRADDPARASGATLGKAMTSLESGRGLVLVLVNLQ